MDELIASCLQNIAFDGDYGCDITRLQTFIAEFYSRERPTNVQNVDTAYRSLIWSYIVQQPSVRVGFPPSDAEAGIWIAPNSKQAKERGEKIPKRIKKEDQQGVGRPSLACLSQEEITTTSLDGLLERYGAKLHIAVDPESCFVALTGSHVRPARLSPMVYTALQIIARSREAGISFNKIEEITGYGVTVHFLVKQLKELGFVEQFYNMSRTERAWAVHRRFVSTSMWGAIPKEEQPLSKVLLSRRSTSLQKEEDLGQATDFDMHNVEVTGNLRFPPLVASDLGNRPMILQRVVELLKQSANGMYRLQDMLIVIGFADPDRRDRRAFMRMIKVGISEGLFEKVLVKSSRVPRRDGAGMVCLRLLSDEERAQKAASGTEAQDAEEGGEQPINRVLATVSLQRQLLSLIEREGMKGMTHNDFVQELGPCDKRMIEHQLEKLTHVPPPPHLSDLGIKSMMEQNGRERRLKYVDHRSYAALRLENPGLAELRPEDVDVEHTGGFSIHKESEFLADDKALSIYTDTYAPMRYSTRTPGDPSKRRVLKVPKPPKTYKNPLGEDGRPRKGRPRKEWTDPTATPNKRRKKASAKEGEDATGASQQKKRKGKATEEGEEDIGAPPAKKRKMAKTEGQGEEGTSTTDVTKGKKKSAAATTQDGPVPTPAKRGRKKKDIQVDDEPISGKAGDAPELQNEPSAALGGENPVIDPDDASKVARPVQARRSLRTSHATEKVLETQTPSKPTRKRGRQPDDAVPYGSAPAKRRKTLVIKAITDAVAGSGGEEITAPQGLDAPSIGLVPIASPQTEEVLPPIISDDVADSSTLAVILQTREALPPTSDAEQLNRVALSRTDGSQVASKSASWSRPLVVPNISLIRRQNELLASLETLGGVTELGHTLLKAHRAHVLSLAAKGDSTSNRVAESGMDRRTLDKALAPLMESGKIQSRTTAVRVHGQALKQVKLIYLAGTPEETISDYCRSLAKNAYISPKPQRKLRRALAISEPTQQPDLVAEKARSNERTKESRLRRIELGEELASMEDESVRRYVLEKETKTVSQFYGYILGVFQRARLLHLAILRHISEPTPARFFIAGEDRILHVDYFFRDLSVATWCSILPTIRYSQQLTDFLLTVEGRETALIDAPPAVHAVCKPTYSRALTKLARILEVLIALDIIVPVQASPASPLEWHPDDAGHPTAFQRCGSTDPSELALYYRINTEMPLYAFCSNPRTLISVESIRTEEEAIVCWNILQELATSKRPTDFVLANAISQLNSEERFPSIWQGESGVIETFGRRQAWDAGYRLSSYQTVYLRKHINRQTGDTPLQDAAAADRIRHICYTLAVPERVVTEFYQAEREAILQLLETLQWNRDEERRQAALVDAIDHTANARLLASKGIQAKERLEAEWRALVSEAAMALPKTSVDADTAGLQELKSRFLVKGGQVNLGKFRDRIIAIVTRTAMPLMDGRQRSGSKASSHSTGSRVVPSGAIARAEDVLSNISSVTEHLEKIQRLIERQIPLPPLPPDNKKNKISEDGHKQRGKRFMWNADLDDLAFDAQAIMQARCPPNKRMDLTPLDAVFPGVRPSGVRNHLSKLREQRPGLEAYTRMLTDAWDVLWRQHRGTDILPDPQPESLRDYDIVGHIAFLRANIDKSKLTTSFSAPMEDMADVSVNLPRKISDLEQHWDVKQPPPKEWEWDFLWTVVTDENRERTFHYEALAFSKTRSTAFESDELEVGSRRVAEAAAKMAASAEEDEDDRGAARPMLELIGEKRMSTALESLCAKGVLAKRAPDRSGKAIAVSESQNSALNGPIPWRVYRDAELLERELASDDESPWPLMATDGNTAALLDLISANEVELNIDTSTCRAKGLALEYNSRKICDQDLENTVLVSRKRGSANASKSSAGTGVISPLEDSVTQTAIHHEEGIAACSRSRVGPINCRTCIDEAFLLYSQSLGSTSDQELALRLRNFVASAGENGKKINQLKTFCSEDSISFDIARRLAGLMTRTSVPVLIATGYDQAVLVSAEYAQSWSITLVKEPLTLTYARRWMTPAGKRSEAIWQSVLRSVMGWIVVRPGIPEVLLRKRVAHILDRPEVNDTLQYLCDKGLARRTDASGGTTSEVVGLTDETDELALHWHAAGEPWYRIN